MYRLLTCLVYVWMLFIHPAIAQPGDYSKMIQPPTPWQVMEVLADDAMGGRGTSEPGGQAAQAYIQSLYQQLGLDNMAADNSPAYIRPFAFEARKGSWTDSLYAGNVCGMIRGTVHPEQYIVVTAHFDHLGEGRPNSAYGKRHEGAIHNGADDNASGVAVLYALAHHFTKNPPRHSLIFLATDGEELGLKGAKVWVDNPPVPLEQIQLNVNLDMVSRADNGLLYAVGTRFHRALREPLLAAAEGSSLELRFGHDARINWVGNSWLLASDHAPFHKVGVPFVYFGVADHDDYHTPSDDIERIERPVFEASMQLITNALVRLDQEFGRSLTTKGKKKRKVVEVR